MSGFALPAYDWKPRADQMGVWRAITAPTFRAGIVNAHRRWGKDELALQATAVHAMSRVGSYWYALPEYAHARRAVWEAVNWRTKRTRIDDAFPPEIVAKRDNQTMMLWLTNGSTVQLVGSDQVDSLVGGGQVGIVLSEASLASPRAEQFFGPVLEESGGWMLQIATPRGKNHFYKSFLATQTLQNEGVVGQHAFHIPATATSVFNEPQLDLIYRKLELKHGATLARALFDQEYMGSWIAMIIGAVWGKELSELETDGRIGDYAHDPRFPVYTSWDLGVGDPTVILFWQKIGSMYRLIDAYQDTDLGVDTYIAILKQKAQDHRYNYAKHIGPHDLAQREKMRGISVMDGARRLGLQFERMPQTNLRTQIRSAVGLIRLMQVNRNSPEALAAFEHFKAYHYPYNRDTYEIVPTPVHDEHSHASSAMMTFALKETASLPQGGTDYDDLRAPAGPDFDPRVYDREGAFWKPDGRSTYTRRSIFG